MKMQLFSDFTKELKNNCGNKVKKITIRKLRSIFSY